jgi:pimeloyl-ACP methyl ester carboxylesterase
MRFPTLCAALSCLAMAACGSRADLLHDVDIKATDGVILKGSYFSPGKPGPAILLFHQGNMDRHSWDGLVSALSAAGFHVLTVDQRGHGGSGGRPLGQVDGPKQGAEDADVTYEYLLSRPDVDRTRVAAGGASSGVTQSVNLAARHHELKALMLLSGFASKSGLAYVAATPSLAIFGAVSKYDDVAASTQEIVAASKNPNSTMKVYSSNWFDVLIGRKPHGVAMFGRNRDLRPAIVTWLQTMTRSGSE